MEQVMSKLGAYFPKNKVQASQNMETKVKLGLFLKMKMNLS